jgi:hypothetical protein
MLTLNVGAAGAVTTKTADVVWVSVPSLPEIVRLYVPGVVPARVVTLIRFPLVAEAPTGSPPVTEGVTEPDQPFRGVTVTA